MVRVLEQPSHFNSVRFLHGSAWRVWGINIVFFIIHAYLFLWMYDTAGQPRQLAIEELLASNTTVIADEDADFFKGVEEIVTTSSSPNNDNNVASSPSPPKKTTEPIKHAKITIEDNDFDDPAEDAADKKPSKKQSETDDNEVVFDDEDDEFSAGGTTKNKKKESKNIATPQAEEEASKNSSSLMDELNSNSTTKKKKIPLNVTALLEGDPDQLAEYPIPSEFAPSASSFLTFLGVALLHGLITLTHRVWSMKFRLLLSYTPATAVSAENTYAHVVPQLHHGSPCICKVEKTLSSTGEVEYLFEYMRRRYVVATAGGGAVKIRKAEAPIADPIAFYVKSNGIVSDSDLTELRRVYGKNSTMVPVPPFWEMYRDRITSPIPIFQLLCSALWFLDEFWMYTMFSLFSLFAFEMSTVSQKRKNRMDLQTMSAKSTANLPVNVYRNKAWSVISAEELVPGDLVALPALPQVPCDCLLIQGSAVTNEASLTGEAVPQMKDRIPEDERKLDIAGRDKPHVLFAGTQLLSASQDDEDVVVRGNVKLPQKDMCLGYVLRTGFQSTQGELVLMMELSQQDFVGNKLETLILLLLLLFFALCAVAYVVKERMQAAEGSKLSRLTSYKLLLRCVMIITSVVPPELPMQMGMTVNMALLALHRVGVFCTEPFRVPNAGSITHCLFDKTGTLTTDQLTCTGVVNANSPAIVAPEKASKDLMAVIAGCQSLVGAGEGAAYRILGDSVELEGLRAIGWNYDPKKNTAAPKSTSSSSEKSTIRILQRHHFSSALQKMSCVVMRDGVRKISVCKGSPEALKSLLVDVPAWYDSCYKAMAFKGSRVLALALKDGGAEDWPRDKIEEGLSFVGFISFVCPPRADTGIVIAALSDAELPCQMITGDAPLTAIHVAKQVNICDPKKPCLQLQNNGDWMEVVDDTATPKVVTAANAKSLKALCKTYNLVVSGSALSARFAEDDVDGLNAFEAECVAVYARMSPNQKERIVSILKHRGYHPMMCGDGGNDVGALKQADVGLALLSGFADTNMGDAEKQSEAVLGAGNAEELLEAQQKQLQAKEQEMNNKFKEEFGKKRAELTAKQQVWFQEEVDKLTAANHGNGGFMVNMTAMKNTAMRLRTELDQETRLLREKHGVTAVWGKGGSGGPADMQKSLESAASEASGRPVIQPGDASIAASFTSRAPSIRAVVHIIRQGRCTHLLSVQTMQILMLESMISAYTLAAVTMEGGRPTETQMIFSGFLVMIATMSFSYAQPADRISPVRPIKSVFHPAIFFSVMLQVLIHLFVMITALKLAKEFMGETALQDLYKFEEKRDEKIRKVFQENEESNSDSMFNFDLWSMIRSVPYRPNVLNTVMFLTKTAQQSAVIVVNYKGRPWMQGATENKTLFLSMLFCCAGLFLCATGLVPGLNTYLELMVVPEELQTQVFALLLAGTVGAFTIDRFLLLLFARDIFYAGTVKPLLETKPTDFVPAFMFFFKIIGGFIALSIALGNPLVGVMMYMGYRRMKAAPATTPATPAA